MSPWNISLVSTIIRALRSEDPGARTNSTTDEDRKGACKIDENDEENRLFQGSQIRC